MLNQLVLVGRLVSDLQINETENETKECNITLAVPRYYKNADGIYETDFISVRLYNGIAENTMKYCKKGDLLGIKGRVQTRQEENKNIIEIIAEKITFLCNKSNKEEE